jgi:hypothetical protein
MRPDRREHAKLSSHVVRLGSNRPQRRAPQYPFAQLEAEQVSQVGMAAGELLDFEKLSGIREFVTQKVSQSGKVDLFATADWRCVSGHAGIVTISRERRPR